MAIFSRAKIAMESAHNIAYEDYKSKDLLKAN